MNTAELAKKFGGAEAGTQPIVSSNSQPIQNNKSFSQVTPQSNVKLPPAELAKQLGGSENNGQNGSSENKGILQSIGDFFIGNTQQFGKTSGEAIASPENTDLYNKAVESYSTVTNNLLKSIKTKKENGGDITHLQNALQMHLQDTPKIEDFVGVDTAHRMNETFGQNAEEIGGQALGTALEATSGGALGGLESKATSIGGKALQGAKVGAIYGGVSGASNAMKEQKDLTGVVTDTGLGALAGGVAGGAVAGVGAGLKEIADKLPNRLVRNAFPGLDEKGAKYALETKPIGTVGKLFKDSADAVVNLNTQLDAVLKHPDLVDEKIDAPKLFNEILYGKNGKSQYTDQTIIKVMKNLAPSEARTIDKLANGEATLFEANQVKKALYAQTKKVFTDTSTQSAKKQLGADIATSIADMIKNQAEDTVPIFDKMSKEINLRNALLKTFKKQDAQKLIGMYDLATAGLGGSIGGLPGAVAGDIGRKVLSNPATKFAGAKILNTIGKTKGVPTIIRTLNTKL